MRVVGRSALHNRTLEVAYRRSLQPSLNNRAAHGDTARLEVSLQSACSAEESTARHTHLRQLIQSETFRRATSAWAPDPLISRGCAVQLAGTNAQ